MGINNFVGFIIHWEGNNSKVDAPWQYFDLNCLDVRL